MKTVLLVFVTVCALVPLTLAGKDRLNKLLDGSQIQLYPHGTDLLLLLHTEYPIENPTELTKVFVCSLTGGKLHSRNRKGPGNLSLVAIPSKNWETNRISTLPLSISWDEDSIAAHTYVIKVLAASSGYVECADNLGVGLRVKDVLHLAGHLSSVTAKYEVRLFSGLVEDLNKGERGPAVIFIDPDTPNYPDVFLRFESVDPFLEGNLTQAAMDIAVKRNWTVKYVRDSLFCPYEEGGGFDWPATRFGRRATPIVPCVDENGTLGPTRRCLGNLLDGAYWEPLGRSQKCMRKSQVAAELLALVRNETAPKLEDLEAAVKANPNSYAAAEVNLISIALERASRYGKSFNLQSFVNVVDAILRIGRQRMKALSGTSGTSERILDAVAQIFQRLESNSSSPVVRKRISALSVRVNNNFSGFALLGNKSMEVFPSAEDKDPNIFQRAKAKVYLVKGSVIERLDFLILEDDSLFKSTDLRRKTVGPVVGVRAANRESPYDIVTLLVAFRKDSANQTTLSCASWVLNVDEDWNLSSIGCRKGIIEGKFHSPKMDVCQCYFPANTLIYISRVELKEQPDFSRFLGMHWKMPRMELLQRRTSSAVFLNVYNRKALEVASPILKSIECLIESNSLDSLPVGLNPRKMTILYDVTPTSHSYIRDMAIIKVSYKGVGKLSCRDRLGIGLKSNQISLQSRSAAVARFRKDSSEKIDKFMSEYVFKYADKYRMGIRAQYPTKNAEELILQFFQTFRSNHSEFYRNVTRLSKKLAKDYEWTLIHVRSTSLCFSVAEEGFQWPTTEKALPAVPVNPCVDSEGIPSPTRRCLEDEAGGSYWEDVPRRPNPCLNPSERAVQLRSIANLDNKADAIAEASRLINDGPSLKSYEVSILSGLLKEAAVGNISLPNISSLATIVDQMLEAGKEVLCMADDTTGSSHLARESIEALLATVDSSKPRIITKPRFYAISVPMDGGIRGFYQEKSSDTRQSIVFLSENASIANIAKKSPKIAVIVNAVGVERGVMSSVVFHDDSLFGDFSERGKARGSVVGLTLHTQAEERRNENNENPVELLIFLPREGNNESRSSCQFWDSRKRRWSGIGCVLLPEDFSTEISDMDVCFCSHITYFSLVRSSSIYFDEESEEVTENLLSLSPFLGIFLSFNCLIGVVLLGFLCAKYKKIGYIMTQRLSTSARGRDGTGVELESLQTQRESSIQTYKYYTYSEEFKGRRESRSSQNLGLPEGCTKPLSSGDAGTSKSSLDESGSATSTSRSSPSIGSDYFSN